MPGNLYSPFFSLLSSWIPGGEKYCSIEYALPQHLCKMKATSMMSLHPGAWGNISWEPVCDRKQEGLLWTTLKGTSNHTFSRTTYLCIFYDQITPIFPLFKEVPAYTWRWTWATINLYLSLFQMHKDKSFFFFLFFTNFSLESVMGWMTKLGLLILLELRF